MQFSIINYGGIMTSLKTPDRKGKLDDIILGFDTLEEYIHDNAYFGAIIGRYTNRIGDGLFKIKETTYQLGKNSGDNNLHGGPNGFNKKIWDISECQNGITLSRTSPDMEEGFPGNLNVDIQIQMTAKNELQISFKAQTDKPTICNLTHHPYFNLEGALTHDILNHELKINATQYTPLNHKFIPNGNLENVADSPFDFENSKKVGKDIISEHPQIAIANGYDHNFVLNKPIDHSSLNLAAKVSAPISGRTMEIWTTKPGLQLFTSNIMPKNLVGRNGRLYGNYCGICLEAQNFPDAPNNNHFPSSILNPGDTYESTTLYKFGVD